MNAICEVLKSLPKELEEHIESHLNISPPYFPEEQITDKTDRFLASELIREKIMRLLIF